MNRKHWMVTLPLIVSILGCGHTPPVAPKKVPKLGARVELAAGNVWLEKETSNQRLITGAMLESESSIELEDGARALIRLGDGTGIFVRGGSSIELQKDQVSLKTGEIWVDVPFDENDLGRFTTGDVTVTASDAGFDIAKEDGQVSVYVARGLAVVAGTSGRSEVENGEIAVVAGDGVPKVSSMGFWEDWTGGMADRELLAGFGGKASGRIYGIDRLNPGAAPKELQIQSQEVYTVIREGVAHTTVDQRFFNPASQDVEGWYWFTIPEGAAVERFALEVHGYLVEGEMTERNQAAQAYEEAVAKAIDPALLEWVDGRTFRARIFPIPKAGERRVVLSYTQFLPLVNGAHRYVYPMGGDGEERIQEFSLHVDLGAEGENFNIATSQDARVEDDASAVSMRRSGFLPRSDFLLELSPIEKEEPLRAYRYSSGYNEADFVMLRYSPEVDFEGIDEVAGHVVVVFDTSAGGGAVERQTRADAAEAILRALSKGDRFAVVTADLSAKVVYPETGLANATDENVSEAMEKLSLISSAGATDLGEMFNVALKLVHSAEQPAVVYVGDGRPTVGEISSLELAGRLRRSLGDSRARLFTLAVGADANHPLLERISRVGGGKSYRIDVPEQSVQEALRFVGQVKTPTITEVEIDAGAGLDQLYSNAAGKVTQGEELIIMARTHHLLPEEITVKGRLAGKQFTNTYAITVEQGNEYGYVPSLWARMYLERLMSEGLDDNRGTIISLGLNFALMTPFTSFLVLENDSAYIAAGIQRRVRNREWDILQNQDDTGSIGGPATTASSQPGQGGSYRGEVKELESVSVMADAQSRPSSPPVDMVAEIEIPPSPSVAQSAPKKPRRSAGSGNNSIGFGKKASGGASEIAMDDLRSEATTQGRRHAFQKGVCSDRSRRPLAQRRVMWSMQLDRMNAPVQYASLFFSAGSSCEVPTWKAKKQLLGLIEVRVNRPSDIQGLLHEFTGYKKYQKYLRRRVLKRTLDAEMAFGLFGRGNVDWFMIRTGLAALEKPKERVERLKEVLAKHPEEPAGRGLLIEALLDAGEIEEALAVATRLRRDELAGPLVLATLCDLQSELGLTSEAKRTCSELVEFNSDSAHARQMLGDLFLRHGWFEAAYRQYKTLVAMRGDEPMSLLRLAIAAAGMGRGDEALRIERKVSAGDGEIGPSDPRRIARLLSAVKISMMLEAAVKEKDADRVKALERALKRTQNFLSPSTFKFIVWNDFEAPLNVRASVGKEPHVLSDYVSSHSVGLLMIDLGKAPPEDVKLNVEMAGTPMRRSVPFKVVSIDWDGKNFEISSSDMILEAGANTAPL